MTFLKAVLADRFTVHIPATISSYRPVRVLGEGSYCLVLLVQSFRPSASYACKVVPRQLLIELQLLESFEREIAIMKSLHHPNLVSLVEVISTSDLIYVIMAFCSGGDLLSLVQSSGPCKEDHLRSIFRDLLRGLDHLHSRGISHRDIKLDNVLLDSSGTAKIADFGLSRHAPRNGLLQTPCGSTEYCPPEILRGLQYDGTKADVWSLGVLLYVLCAGSLPWASRNPTDVYMQAIAGDFPVPAAAPPAVAALLRRMLAPEPSARPAVAELLAEEWVRAAAQPIRRRSVPVFMAATKVIMRPHEEPARTLSPGPRGGHRAFARRMSHGIRNG